MNVFSKLFKWMEEKKKEFPLVIPRKGGVNPEPITPRPNCHPVGQEISKKIKVEISFKE